MKIINNRLNSELNLRIENDFPIKGVNFIDITPLIMDKKIFNKIINHFVNELKSKNIDYIVAPEARGFLFASAIAYKLDIGIIPVRKKGKLPPSYVEASFNYEKEYGKDILELPKLIDDNYQDKKFYIIDDIYATGNTISSIKSQIINLGGTVVGVGAIINIVELNDNKDLYSLVNVNE